MTWQSNPELDEYDYTGAEYEDYSEYSEYNEEEEEEESGAILTLDDLGLTDKFFM